MCEIEEGKEIQGGERLRLTQGELQFNGSFDREEEEAIRPGDEILISLEGGGKTVPSVVRQVDLISSQDTGTFTSSLEAADITIGERASFTCKRKSEIYPTVIPVEALRKDMKGDYCLVLRKQKTILGEEYKAARVDVEVLLRGDTEAAVEGAFMEDEPIIKGSNRVIQADDRVRPIVELKNEP